MKTAKRPGKARVAIVCSGMDKVKRGYEIHARDLFDLLNGDPEIELKLLKGNGPRRAGEKVVFNLHRDGVVNRMLCRVVGTRWKYYIEYVSFAVGLIPLLLFRSFDAFYVMEAPLYKFLSRWRQHGHLCVVLVFPRVQASRRGIRHRHDPALVMDMGYPVHWPHNLQTGP